MKEACEKPIIKKLHTGLMNKYGRSQACSMRFSNSPRTQSLSRLLYEMKTSYLNSVSIGIRGSVCGTPPDRSRASWM